jgi:hypothetical protein
MQQDRIAKIHHVFGEGEINYVLWTVAEDGEHYPVIHCDTPAAMSEYLRPIIEGEGYRRCEGEEGDYCWERPDTWMYVTHGTD